MNFAQNCILQDKRREIYFHNRAALLQRAKFKQEKDRVLSLVKEMQQRGPSVDSLPQQCTRGVSAAPASPQVRAGHFNIVEVIQLLNLCPDNEMAIYDVRSPSTCNDYSQFFFFFFFFFFNF